MDASIYRLKYRDILTLCIIALLAFGVIMVQSASMRVTSQTRWQWTAAGMAQLKLAIVALIVYFIVGRFDYARLSRGPLKKNPILWLVAAAALLCLMVLVPGVGRQVNGARRWISLGFTQLQPSELGKWGAVFFLAWCLAFRPVRIERFFGGFLLMLLPVGAI